MLAHTAIADSALRIITLTTKKAFEVRESSGLLPAQTVPTHEKGARVPKLNKHLCWGCRHDRFDTIPGLLGHVEDEMCDAGCNIEHIKALALGCDESQRYVIQHRLPWLLAGAPPHFARVGNYAERTREFVCPKCETPFESKDRFTRHLRTCPEGYSLVLCCPECSTSRSFRISELVEHVESLDCRTDPDTPSRKILFSGLKKKLKYMQEQQRLNKIRYELRSYVGRPDEVLVVDTELNKNERER